MGYMVYSKKQNRWNFKFGNPLTASINKIILIYDKDLKSKVLLCTNLLSPTFIITNISL